jgi:hypothetical protein
MIPATGDSQIMLQITEAEFEELMSKNRNVSSNAISRAVSDASAGTFFTFVLFLTYQFVQLFKFLFLILQAILLVRSRLW